MANAHAHRQRVRPTKNHDATKCVHCLWRRNGAKGKKPKNSVGHRHNPGGK